MKTKIKSHGIISKSLAVVLVITMMLSVCIVGTVSTSAANGYGYGFSNATKSPDGSSLFSEGEYLYLDCSSATAWASNDAVIKCLMYTDWNTWVDSVTMLKIADNVYRCYMQTNHIKYIMFQRYSSDGSTLWNTFEYVNSVGSTYTQKLSVTSNDVDNVPRGKAEPTASDNCFYIESFGVTAGEDTGYWGTYTSDPDETATAGTYVTKTATNSDSMTASNLKLVSATFYDYYNNDEMNGEWIKSLDGSERSYVDREPFTYFNSAVAAYASNNSSWSYPLYFGDFNRSSSIKEQEADTEAYWQDGYIGSGVSGLVRYCAVANNSNAPSSGTNGAVAGLVDSTLSSNGYITSGGVNLPYFDENFLSDGYGATVSSDFAFRIETDSNGDTYYEYDSGSGTDNFWFTNVTTSPVANYAYDSYKIYDAAAGFGNDSNGYGFFPFDERDSSNATEANDFGFGVKLEIPFVLREDGMTENDQHVTFSFSGDDDLWVFIDGELVLDLGGAHKEAEGTIDFTDKIVTYTSGIDESLVNSGISVASVSTDVTTESFDIDYGTSHTMTVAYMERGMVESNISVGFNMDVIDNLLTTSKTVDTADVNDGLKSTVSSLDDFTITNYDNTSNSALANKEYSKTSGSTTTDLESDDDGNYTIKDSEEVSFENIVDSKKQSTQNVGDNITVSESGKGSSLLTYDTTFVVTDKANDVVLDDSKAVVSNDGVSFVFENTQNTDELTYFDVAVTNTPQVGSITVTKDLKTSDGTTTSTDTTTEFNYVISLDLDGDGTYETYDLVTSEGNTATSGAFTLTNGSSVTFEGIPIGVAYKVEEVNLASTYEVVTPSSGVYNGTLDSSNADTLAFTNKEVRGSVTVLKQDQSGSNVSGATFSLYKVSGDGAAISETDLVDSLTTDSSGSGVKFSELDVYQSDGTTKQWYAIKETAAPDGYVVNSTITYFTLPQYALDGKVVDSSTAGATLSYDITYTYTDATLTMPNASGNGTNTFTIVGCSVLGAGLLLASAYIIHSRNLHKKRRYRHSAK